ncbi:PepSY-like domain-containing protein [Hymenobacter sp. 15J16-1T3B]|uniref:PepSY-like domain-containing protein n=1 Tax=Hymenobacter sp. 15J16-1T3B TaxID=2886941 RepID=UPI001D12FF71|nr:PepSY-like domain-containing protein [Hymenobacter sp. 15J16-1T3B]MCC3160159.1 PepSY-like domain-containing protein [Hymenobacter sp. 15J16-1T3B]
MKKTLLLLALTTGAAVAVQAQELTAKQVPAAVTAAFHKAHPAAKQVKWEKEDGNYEAEFKQGAEELSVVMTADGKLLETETEIRVAQLPAAVRGKLTSAYAGYQVTEAAKIVTAATGATTYEAELRKPGKKMDVIFDASGGVVKTEADDAKADKK